MKWNIGASSSSLPTGHPAVDGPSGQPPASCPMHKSDTPSSGSVYVPVTPANAVASSSKAAECPIPHDRRSRPAASPYDVSSTPSSSRPSSDKGASCPIPHDQREFHPLNAIPMGLSATDKAPGQVLDLPIEREISSIPRPKVGDATDEDHAGKWEYPSPQQFYNALVRKGQETPEESIEMVVAIHNFLNEQAWEEVLKWEKRLPGGDQAQLSRFQGRPGTLSPKARFHLWAGSIFPSKFNTEPPFDRHDWIVTRPIPATGNAVAGVKPVLTTTRYVIDYYSAPPDEDGNPVFSLDVRPALDSFESVSQRVRVGVEEWLRGESQ